jgi:hypothetical protein
MELRKPPVLVIGENAGYNGEADYDRLTVKTDRTYTEITYVEDGETQNVCIPNRDLPLLIAALKTCELV